MTVENGSEARRGSGGGQKRAQKLGEEMRFAPGVSSPLYRG
jgi:hypothetical protein